MEKQLVITDPSTNNNEPFICSHSDFYQKYKLNPGVITIFEGDEKACIIYCKSIVTHNE